jgi:hypothetical protein
VHDRGFGEEHRDGGEGDRGLVVAAVVGELARSAAPEPRERDGGRRADAHLDAEVAPRARMHQQVADRLSPLPAQPPRDREHDQTQRQAKCDDREARAEAHDQRGGDRGRHRYEERPAAQPSTALAEHEPVEQDRESRHIARSSSYFA